MLLYLLSISLHSKKELKEILLHLILLKLIYNSHGDVSEGIEGIVIYIFPLVSSVTIEKYL